MSWRETLGVIPSSHTPSTQNSQNTQKPSEPTDCADIANFAHRDSEEESSRLLEALADACQGLSITPAEVRQALAQEDIDDWRNGTISSESMAAFARSLEQQVAMNQGKRPAHFSDIATCKHCGPIWLWFSGEVLGCPWCWNRATDRPIPRPGTVQCGDCSYFERMGHRNLGQCAKSEPEAISGLWDTDQRQCDRFLPRRER